MNKLLVAVSVCVGAFGFGGNVMAASYSCDDSDTFCGDGDLYSVELNCFDRSTDPDPEFTGTLIEDFPGWVLSISYDDEVDEGDPSEVVCGAAGVIMLDSEGSKTEYKCSEQPNGPKKTWHKFYEGETLQVDFEIKLEEAGSDECD
jgi:hypothetical protein